MEELWSNIAGFFSRDRWMVLLQAGVTLTVGLVIARVVAALVARVLKRAGVRSAPLFRRITFYALVVLVVFATLQVLGVDLSLLLGAAGILTVAIGFASQTSASNIISGLFLISERPFVPGDIIDVESTVGEVVAIDLLSVKLRTFDNRFVRVPNESLLKAHITNLSHFPIRRVDVLVGVAYKEDLYRVRDLLVAVADRNPRVFDEPKPMFQVLGYGDSAVDVQFSAWTARESYYEVRTALRMEIKRAFDENGVEIPFPHRSLYTGSATEPFPIRLVREDVGGGVREDADDPPAAAPSRPPD